MSLIMDKDIMKDPPKLKHKKSSGIASKDDY